MNESRVHEWATAADRASSGSATKGLATARVSRYASRSIAVAIASTLLLGAAAPMQPSAAATVVPVPGEAWQWMLSSVPKPADLAATPEVRAWDIDGFDASSEDVDDIHALPATAVCYISAGSFENWRSDAGDFPDSVKGKNLDGWAGEKWLDIRQIAILEPIMSSRMQMCEEKGFDAVEADNVDGYTNRSGFPLTATHQLAYNRMLADTAHALGLSIALKNDIEQVETLEPDFDFAINEQCYQYNECGVYDAFADAGKAVWIVEYKTAIGSFCPKAIAAGYDAMKKKVNLGVYRVGC